MHCVRTSAWFCRMCFLFSGSVMDNITLRNPSISRTRVIEAAKLIDVHDFIMRLPGGYDYNVMERGSTLSLGQRQLDCFHPGAAL